MPQKVHVKGSRSLRKSSRKSSKKNSKKNNRNDDFNNMLNDIDNSNMNQMGSYPMMNQMDPMMNQMNPMMNQMDPMDQMNQMNQMPQMDMMMGSQQAQAQAQAQGNQNEPIDALHLQHLIPQQQHNGNISQYGISNESLTTGPQMSALGQKYNIKYYY